MGHAPGLEPLGADAHGRPVLLLHVARLADVPAHLGLPRPTFLLLVVMDATSETHDARRDFATAAIDDGCIYMCAWGPGCTEVDDDFDMVQVMRDIERDAADPGASERDAAPFVMTTWHDGVSIEEALAWWFDLAEPDSGGGARVIPIEDQCRIAVIVGDPAWADAVRRDVARRVVTQP